MRRNSGTREVVGLGMYSHVRMGDGSSLTACVRLWLTRDQE